MTGPDIDGAVQATCEQIASKHRLELVEIAFKGGRRGKLLSVIIDRPGGAVSMHDVTVVSEDISAALDEQDPIEGSYTLEVSSAGLERPLVRPEHYRRFIGREVSVKCISGIEGRRNFKGVLRSAGDETFVIAAEDGPVVEIPYGEVSRTKLVVDWDAELRGGQQQDQAS